MVSVTEYNRFKAGYVNDIDSFRKAVLDLIYDLSEEIYEEHESDLVEIEDRLDSIARQTALKFED